MTRVVYVNGRYLPYASAKVHVEDRGFQFADAVYEVIEIRQGQLVDEAGHLARLQRSLKELAIPVPMQGASLSHVVRETIRRNRVTNGIAYMQVTRGQAPRDFFVPTPAPKSTLVCLARRTDPARIAAQAEAGIEVRSMPDIRWGRCDIKTVMLLPAVLAKEAARSQGAKEAWFVDREGLVTEGASSNAWIVTQSGDLMTHPVDRSILPGITRSTLVSLLAREGLNFIERAFSLEEALRSREVFITSASGTVMPVVRIDGHPVGDGRPGQVARGLRAIFHSAAKLSGG